MDLEVITCADVSQWEAWLDAHHAVRDEVWLKIAKKDSGVKSVTSAEALQGALCYGWIDGVRKSFDGTYFLQRYSPRRPKSAWSQVNVAYVEALMEAGRMREPGLAQVRAAQEDGRWDAAYPSQKTFEVPAEFEAALSAKAAAVFWALSRTDRFLLLLPIFKALPARRPALIAKTVAALEARET